MKSILLSGAVAALLVFSGCSSKEPVVDQPTKPAQEVKAVETESVSTQTAMVGENAQAAADTNELDMAAVERKLSSVYFDFDKFNIRNDMLDKVSNDATVAKTVASGYTVKLEGNCDEWGSDEYNFALGLKRAATVKKALVAQGVQEDRITMVSYGESNPVCSDKTKECWSQNRRVDFKLLP